MMYGSLGGEEEEEQALRRSGAGRADARESRAASLKIVESRGEREDLESRPRCFAGRAVGLHAYVPFRINACGVVVTSVQLAKNMPLGSTWRVEGWISRPTL
eukprot:2833979-Rhodomonas_salina.1